MLRYADAIVKRGVDKLIELLRITRNYKLKTLSFKPQTLPLMGATRPAGKYIAII